MNHYKAIDTRVFKYKNKTRDFFCPLCRTQRHFGVSPKLNRKNYIQIALSTIVLGSILAPIMGPTAFSVFFFIWGLFELIIRSDFKKQIPCEHCGFDASDYKRDVKVARAKVKQFWDQKATAKSSTSDSQS